jgi:hypothetical protein
MVGLLLFSVALRHHNIIQSIHQFAIQYQLIQVADLSPINFIVLILLKEFYNTKLQQKGLRSNDEG